MGYKSVVFSQIAEEALEEFPAWKCEDRVTKLTAEVVRNIIEKPGYVQGPLVTFINGRALAYGIKTL